MLIRETSSMTILLAPLYPFVSELQHNSTEQGPSHFHDTKPCNEIPNTFHEFD
jgi:hypothetical protein